MQNTEKQPINVNNLSNEKSYITYDDHISRNGHKGGIIWLTGLSGSGKSTIAKNVEQELFNSGKQVYILDGDNIRKGLSKDLGFTTDDRTENIRRIAEVALLFARAGFIIITSFISPIIKDRQFARTISDDLFHCIYISATIETCKKRDPKGLYKKALAGEVKNFTGIDSPYEPPINPNLVIDTNSNSVENSTNKLLDYINKNLNLKQ